MQVLDNGSWKSPIHLFVCNKCGCPLAPIDLESSLIGFPDSQHHRLSVVKGPSSTEVASILIIHASTTMMISYEWEISTDGQQNLNMFFNHTHVNSYPQRTGQVWKHLCNRLNQGRTHSKNSHKQTGWSPGWCFKTLPCSFGKCVNHLLVLRDAR